MKLKIKVILLISFFSLASCTYTVRNNNQYMAVISSEKEVFPSEGKALLIVERTQELNLSAYDMIVWDVTERLNPALIGYLAPSMKAAYELMPGKYTLLLQMAATNNAMEITVAADKTYYTKIGTKGYGIYFFPIKKGQENSINRKNISVASDYLVSWGEDRERIENSLQVRIDKGVGKWGKMSDEEMIEKNIIAEDGR
jgi:hypothetical protein